MNVRRVSAGLAGVVAFGFVLAAAAMPGLTDLVPLRPGVAESDQGYLLVAAVGTVSILLVTSVLATRATFGIDQATPPEPETPQEVPYPGESFDEATSGRVGVRGLLFGDHRDEVERRLTEAAIRTEMHAEGISRSAARDRVADGSWTDDEAASAFLATDDRPGVRTLLWSLLGSRSPFQRAARRTADAVYRRTESSRGAGSSRGAASSNRAESPSRGAASSRWGMSSRRAEAPPRPEESSR